MQPRRPIFRNTVLAFLIGGAICALAQLFLSYLLGRGMPQKEALAATSGFMVFWGALLTGLGVYDVIGRVGGMGAALPITGFANSMVSPALEYKREGYVLGVGAKLFTIAGPVIVYGLVAAVLVVLLRWLITGHP
ncbi:MAG: SpoVA/SpoVAEb family sporulation membrane protein [Bacillota bacterium]|nr:SpoVA/SpoVAEb family sporulation membrane protein [Bacillota bacterium]